MDTDVSVFLLFLGTSEFSNFWDTIAIISSQRKEEDVRWCVDGMQ